VALLSAAFLGGGRAGTEGVREVMVRGGAVLGDISKEMH